MGQFKKHVTGRTAREKKRETDNLRKGVAFETDI